MDQSDPNIAFDAFGICNHCRLWEQRARQMTKSGSEAASSLEIAVDGIRRAGRGRDFDCIIGVSGGVDSTYVAYLVRSKLGLRPLAVHLDNGWNSTTAVTNIGRTLDTLRIELETEVLDWDEFRDIQLAFLRASTPDSEIPTDHAIQAALMSAARRHDVRFIIGGSNIASEGILPRAWSNGVRDWKYIREIHRRFGTRPLRSFPHFTLADFVRFWTVERRRRYDVLNFVEYSKEDAYRTIQTELGWQPYGAKHYESVYTRFYQGYILPTKFGFDKRRAHLSTLVNSGQVTRDQALSEILTPSYNPDLLRQDLRFVTKKLEISADHFDEILRTPPKTFDDYPSYERSWYFKMMRAVWRAPRRLRG